MQENQQKRRTRRTLGANSISITSYYWNYVYSSFFTLCSNYLIFFLSVFADQKKNIQPIFVLKIAVIRE